MAILGFFMKDKMKQLDEQEKAIIQNKLDVSSARLDVANLALTISKDYATNQTVQNLFTTAASSQKESLDRVHARIDDTNASVSSVANDIKTLLARK